jgi:hypothetical protein
MANAKNQSKYEELEQIKAGLAEEVGKLRTQLGQAESRLAAVTLAIQVWKSKGLKEENDIEYLDPYLQKFKGLTQIQALTLIAKENGNWRFKLNDAKRILTQAGLVKSKKNASTILFTAIQRSEKFKRVAPGEYELVQKPVSATLTFQSENLKRIQA